MFCSSTEYGLNGFLLQILNPVISYLTRARITLIIPKKRSFDELKAALHRRHFVPPLPADMSASFYIQAHKIVFALYQMLPGAPKFDCFQVGSKCRGKGLF